MKQILLLLLLLLSGPLFAANNIIRAIPVVSIVCTDGYRITIVQTTIAMQAFQLLDGNGTPAVCGTRKKNIIANQKNLAKMASELWELTWTLKQ